MAPKRVREKRRAARFRQKERAQQKNKELELSQDDFDELDITESSDTTEPEEDAVLEKDYDSHKGYMDMPRPKSWEEAEELRRAQEKAMKVNDISWTVRDLVSNIVHSDMEPDEKGKAIADVGNGLAQRVKSIAGEKVKKELDLDVLELNALIARDRRHLPILERIGDFLTKSVLTTEAEKKLSDDDFALVTERDGKKVRKYPIHDKAHVRNALARAAQMMKEGGEAATDARAALPKIRAAAKKMGIGAMEKSSSAVVVEKDASGSWRAVMWPSNNFKDFDGEIIAEKAHQEYVEWLDENKNLAPVFTTWHEPELVRKHQVDFAAYESGYLIMSAPLTEEDAAGLLIAQEVCDLGMSHGSIVLERDERNPKIITKYRMVEVSDLPLENAANPFTDFSVISKEADMDKQKYLASLLGEERAKEFLEKTGLKQAELREAGVEEKGKTDTTPEPVTEPAKTDEKAAVPDMETILKAVSDQFDIKGLNAFVQKAQDAIEKVVVLEELVKALSGDNDEKLAEKIAPPVTQKMAWTMRASQSKDNHLNEADDKDKLLKQSGPKHWLSEVTGVEPVTE